MKNVMLISLLFTNIASGGPTDKTVVEQVGKMNNTLTTMTASSEELCSKEEKKVDDFSSMVAKLTGNGDYCSHTKKEIQEMSLAVMDKSIKVMDDKLMQYLSEVKKKITSMNLDEIDKSERLKRLEKDEQFLKSMIEKESQEKNDFTDLMEKKWHQIRFRLERLSKFKDGGGDPLVLKYMYYALSYKFIPLPIFNETMADGKGVFTFSSLYKYFLLGLAPVSVDYKSKKDLADNPSHPLYSFVALKSTGSFASHDLEHAKIMAENRHHLIPDERRCQKFKKCLDDLLPEASPDRKQILFFLLHEEKTQNYLSTTKRKTIDLPYSTLLDFALELVISKKEFNLVQFLGDDSEERKKTCQNLRHIDDDREKMKFLIGPVEGYVSDSPLNQALGESGFVEKSSYGFVTRDLVRKFLRKCYAEFPHLQADQDNSHAFEYKYNKIKDSFLKALNDKLLKLKTAYEDLHNDIKEKPACSEVF